LLNTPVNPDEFLIESKKYSLHSIILELSKPHKLIKWYACAKAFPLKKPIAGM